MPQFYSYGSIHLQDLGGYKNSAVHVKEDYKKVVGKIIVHPSGKYLPKRGGLRMGNINNQLIL
jgi:hypothetical protein